MISTSKYLIFLLPLLLIQVFGVIGNAQTGPGGIGNSTVNGLWLCAEDAGTTDASAVATWADRSGNGNDASNSASPQQPLFYTSSLLNSQPVVRFDGNNDQMSVNDADILDGSSGITMYAAIRPNNLNGAPRGILGKRISSGTTAQYAYTWFFWSGNDLYHDLNTQNNRYDSSPITYSNSTNYILAFNFDGTRSAANRCRLYEGSDIIKISTESSTSVVNSNRDLVLGALNFNYGTYLGADFGEVIHFNYSLDSLEHMIVQNYLSAKFNISISANDLYIQDNPANGDYDFDVCGIGRIDASTIHDDSQGAARVRVLNPSDLGNNEFLLWGHDGGVEEAIEFSDVPTGVEARFDRVWRVNEVNGSGTAVDVGSLEMRWDLSNLNSITATDLCLLVDTDNDGLFSDETPISGANDLGGNIFSFTGVTQITNNVRFTIATSDYSQTPLPVTFLDFTLDEVSNEVRLSWKTLSEINNDYFAIERSKDAYSWKEIGVVKGNGNSRTLKKYKFIDEGPVRGANYYRLKQVDFNGDYSFSTVLSFRGNGFGSDLSIYPNPVGDVLYVKSEIPIKTIKLFDSNGKEVLLTNSVQINVTGFQKGSYTILVFFENGDEIKHQVLIY